MCFNQNPTGAFQGNDSGGALIYVKQQRAENSQGFLQEEGMRREDWLTLLGNNIFTCGPM